MAEEPGGRGPRFYPLASLFYLLLAIAGVVGLGAERGRLTLGLLFDRGSWWIDLAAGAACGAALLALWAGCGRWSAGARRVEAEIAARLGDLTAGEALALAAVSALAEEIAFRGALQGWLGLPAAAALFALAHLGPARHFLWWTLWALAGGLALGALVAERGTLGAAIVAHLLINGVQLERLRRRAAPSAA